MSTTLKINHLTLFDYWHNNRCSWLGQEEIERITEAVNRLYWPGKRAPRVEKVRVFSWDDVDWVEIQISYHRGCWKKAVYRVLPGESVLICKDWKAPVARAENVCPF